MHDTSNLPMVGGHPALDLVNTVERGVPRPDLPNQDFLVGPDAVVTWAERAAVLSDAEAAVQRRAWEADSAGAQRAVQRLSEIRETLYAVLVAAIDKTAEPTRWESEETGRLINHLHREWQAAVSRSTLVRTRPGPALRVQLDLAGDPGELVADRVAQLALDLLQSNEELGRVEECPVEAGGCGWLFLDRSRNRSRRWCRMADCGNTVKARRLTERRRAARSAEN